MRMLPESHLIQKINRTIKLTGAFLQISVWCMMFENSYFGGDMSAQILAILSKSHCAEMFYDSVKNKKA